MGVSVQQEVAPRVSVNVGYYRNWWGNWYTRGQSLDRGVGLHAVQCHRAARCAATRRRRQRRHGLYNLVPGKVGQVDELAQHTTNFGEAFENWQGVDVNVVARLRMGLTVQGGTSTGRRAEDACGIKATIPEYGEGPAGENNSIVGGSPVESVLPRDRAVSDRLPRVGDVHDSARRRADQRHVAEQPR